MIIPQFRGLSMIVLQLQASPLRMVPPSDGYVGDPVMFVGL